MPAEDQSTWAYLINYGAPFIRVFPLLVVMVLWDIQRKYALATGCLAASWLIVFLFQVWSVVSFLRVGCGIPFPTTPEFQQAFAESLIINGTCMLVATAIRWSILCFQRPESDFLTIPCSRWLVASVLLGASNCIILTAWLVWYCAPILGR